MIIFTILLWILIWVLLILLALLGLVILIAVVLCLGRIKYQVNVKIGQDTKAYIDVRYLMRLIRFVGVYKEGRFRSRFRIAWYRLDGENDTEKNTESESKDPEEPPPDINAALESAIAYLNGLNAATDESEMDAPEETQADQESSQEDELKDEPRKTIMQRLQALMAIKDKLTSAELKIIMNLCKRALHKFVRALRPKRFKINGVIGFDDPSHTGWFMGAYEAIIGAFDLRQNIRLLGSYHESALRLEVDIKGRVRLFRLMWPVIWLYLHKPIRTIINKQILRKGDDK